jgi:hypothetical protein
LNTSFTTNLLGKLKSADDDDDYSFGDTLDGGYEVIMFDADVYEVHSVLCNKDGVTNIQAKDYWKYKSISSSTKNCHIFTTDLKVNGFPNQHREEIGIRLSPISVQIKYPEVAAILMIAAVTDDTPVNLCFTLKGANVFGKEALSDNLVQVYMY